VIGESDSSPKGGCIICSRVRSLFSLTINQLPLLQARVMSLTGEGVNHQWFGEHFVAREGEQVVDMGTVAR
jgi:hypothetical protein